MLRYIEATYDCKIDLRHEGVAYVHGKSRECVSEASRLINDLVALVKEGDLFSAEVLDVKDFGVVVKIARAQEVSTVYCVRSLKFVSFNKSRLLFLIISLFVSYAFFFSLPLRHSLPLSPFALHPFLPPTTPSSLTHSLTPTLPLLFSFPSQALLHMSEITHDPILMKKMMNELVMVGQRIDIKVSYYHYHYTCTSE